MRVARHYICALSLAAAVVPSAFAAPILGAAQSFAVLGAASLSNTGLTTIVGDVGLYPGKSFTGASSVTVVGGVHLADTAAQQALLDADAAYGHLAALASTSDLSGQDLGGLILMPGVYFFASSAQLTGMLTLDAGNDPRALFVFQVGTTLTTATAASVQVINGSAGTGVFFDVGTSATLGSATRFAGNILARQSIALNNGAQILCGRAAALAAVVTTDTNVVANDCSQVGLGQSDFGSAGFSGLTVVPAPAGVAEPATLPLAGAALVIAAALRRRPAGRTA